MTSFTDNDLKRLKESIAGMQPSAHMQWATTELEAFLFRLEAAEKAMKNRSQYNLQRWRKAAGK